MTNSFTPNLTLTEQVEDLIAELDIRKKERDTTCAPLALDAYNLARQSADKSLWIKAATALTHYYTDITSEFDKAIIYLKEQKRKNQNG